MSEHIQSEVTQEIPEPVVKEPQVVEVAPSVVPEEFPKEESFEEKFEKLMSTCSNDDLEWCAQYIEKEIQLCQFSTAQQLRIKIEIAKLNQELEEQKHIIDEELKKYQMSALEKLKEIESEPKVEESEPEPATTRKPKTLRVTKASTTPAKKPMTRKPTSKKIPKN